MSAPDQIRADPGRDGRGFTVLVVEPSLEENGAVRVVLRLVQRWRAAGVRVALFELQRPRPGTRQATPPSGVTPVYPTPAGREVPRRLLVVAGLLRLLPLTWRADVVLSGREIGLGLVLARTAARLTRTPFVTLVQSDPVAAMEHHETPKVRALVRWALTTADRLVCVSPGLVPSVRALGIEPDRISVVLNGVDVAGVARAAGESAPARPDGEGPLVVGLGRLTEQKGFDVLVRAHARVVAAGIPHRLLLLGEGPDRDALTRLAAELGVSGSVHLPGFAANPLPTLAAADLFCLPSRWEGSPLTIAEAMIVGTPTVAADCVSGPRHLLADGAYGDLVPVDDVDALAAAIERHLRDPDRLRAAMVEGRAWARAHLDIGRAASETLDVLREVAGGPPSRRAGRRR